MLARLGQDSLQKISIVNTEYGLFMLVTVLALCRFYVVGGGKMILVYSIMHQLFLGWKRRIINGRSRRRFYLKMRRCLEYGPFSCAKHERCILW